MKAYYEQDGIRIIHGDCRDVMPCFEFVEHGATTIEGLVKRGLMVYSRWMEGRKRFPIEATVVEGGCATRAKPGT